MATEPENLVLELLRGIRAEVSGVRSEVGSVRADMTSELTSLRADVASDFVTLGAKVASDNKATRDQIVGLRRAVIEYHSVVVGHGILISELEARVRRMEQHLNLPSLDAH
jgi:hypothetical protein